MVQGEYADTGNIAPIPGVGSAYNHGWKYLWKHFPILLVIGIIYVVLSFIISIPQMITQLPYTYDFASIETLFTGSIAISIIGLLYSIFFLNPVGYGQSFAYLKASRNQNVEVKDMFASFENYWNVVGASLLVMIFTGIAPAIAGIILSVPGMFLGPLGLILIVIAVLVVVIFLACKLAFVPFIVVDRKMGGWEAIKESWRLSNGHAGQVFLIFLLGIPIIIAGLICLLIGVIISIMWINSSGFIPAVGSSRNRILGSIDNARASSTLLCTP